MKNKNNKCDSSVTCWYKIVQWIFPLFSVHCGFGEKIIPGNFTYYKLISYALYRVQINMLYRYAFKLNIKKIYLKITQYF